MPQYLTSIEAQMKVFGITITTAQIISSLIFLAIAITLTQAIKYFVRYKLKNTGSEEEKKVGNLILNALSMPFSVFIYLWAASTIVNILRLPYLSQIILFLRALIIIDFAWMLFRLTDAAIEIIVIKYNVTDLYIKKQLLPLAGQIIKVIFGIIAFIAIAQSVGFSVTSLLAGLSVLGLAIALAARDTVANLFGSINIFLDKPFIVGDWVVMEDIEGIVEDIGLRSTNIRTFNKTLVNIPNYRVVTMNVEDFSRIGRWRVRQDINVRNDSDPEDLKEAISRIRQIVAAHPKTNHEIMHIYFSKFANTSLQIYVYYFIETRQWDEFMRVREEINFMILEELTELGVQFALPSLTLEVGQREFIRTK